MDFVFKTIDLIYIKDGEHCRKKKEMLATSIFPQCFQIHSLLGHENSPAWEGVNVCVFAWERFLKKFLQFLEK